MRIKACCKGCIYRRFSTFHNLDVCDYPRGYGSIIYCALINNFNDCKDFSQKLSWIDRIKRWFR